MAKAGSDFNIVEQHAEKAVLGVCALLFLYMLFSWGFSSPRKFDVPTGRGRTPQPVPPGKIDSSLLEYARDIERWIEQAKFETKALPSYDAEISRLQNAEEVSAFQMINLASGIKKPVFTEIPTPRRVSLAAVANVVPSPGEILIWAGQVLPKTENPQDKNVGHIIAEFPWAELTDKWSETLKGTAIVARPVVLNVIVEVQEKQSGETWSDPRRIEPVRVAVTGSERQPEIPAFTGNNADAVRAGVTNFAQETWQKEILQPEYWDIWYPAAQTWVPWRVNLPESSVSQSVPREEAGSVDVPVLAATPAAPARTPARPPVAAPEEGLPPEESPRLAPKSRIASAPAGPALPSTETVAMPALTSVPPLAKQMKDGKVLVWVHDESLQSGKTYRYRMKVVFANPLLTYVDYVEADSPQDAAVIAVESPFSEWSQPITVISSTRFFLTSSSSTSNFVTITVFTRALGQQVEKSFKIFEGQPIGAIDSVEVRNPLTGEPMKVQANFTTGATAVEFNFNRRIISDRGIARDTVEMLYLDEEGNLRSRIYEVDRNSEEYKKLREEVRNAARVGGR